MQAYLRDPSKLYDENRHRRLMPRQALSRYVTGSRRGLSMHAQRPTRSIIS